ncbi:MAG TPA: flagellar biosynthesis anti-sigma factor FlgM [Terriglobales bacterium]|nr:flagellar biosynthesis anti-sigma factor FlgM [Terriglobales bacterium]
MTTIPSGNDPQAVRNSGNTARASKAARASGSTPAPGASPDASLHVSAGASRFVSLRARLESLDAVRAERVEQLRLQVATGAYHPSADAIAAAMLDDPATAAALGMR